MDEEAGKIFVGGLSWETADDGLKNYFQTNFGEVIECTIMRDQATQRSRGFGFVTFRDPSVVQKVLSQQKHNLDGRDIDPKAAVPRGSGPPPSSGRGGSAGRGGRGGASGGAWMGQSDTNRGFVPFQGPTKKIFIGGIGHGTTDEDIKAYFSSYGTVVEVIVKYDQRTQRMRGFGFVTFDNEASVDRLCEIHYHTINGKTVEVKKAEPRNTSGGNQMTGPYGMGRASHYTADTSYYANTYGQPRGYGPAAGYGAPQTYGGAYGAPTAGYGQPPYGAPSGTAGYGYGASGYGQSGPGYGGQYGPASGYGPGPSQGYGSQAQASGYDSYGTASSQPSQGQDYNSTGTSTYNYGGAAGRMGGYGQDQAPYGTQAGGYSQDRTGAYSGQTGYGQTPPGGTSGPAAGSADTTSYGQQAGAYGGDYRTAQGFSQQAGSAPQQARPYTGYQ